MAKSLKSGDHVAWDSSQSEVTGQVKKKLVTPTEIKGHHFAALPENPEYLVESEKTGAAAAHKLWALRKVAKPRKKGSNWAIRRVDLLAALRSRSDQPE